MEAENILTEKIVKSALEKLVLENKWAAQLKEKMEVLLITNSLSNISSIYEAFRETASIKEEDPSD